MRQMLISWAVTSSFLILAVIALRAGLGKRMGAGLRYALWGLVLVRLLVPVQLFSSPILGTTIDTQTVVTQETQTGQEALGGRDVPQMVVSASPAVPSTPAAPDSSGFPASPETPVVPVAPVAPVAPGAPDWRAIPAALGWVWLAGGIVMALVLLGCNLRFWVRLRRTRRSLAEDRADDIRPYTHLPVYASEGLPSPCLFGLFRPAIYVAPETAADPNALRHVLAHESTHASHGDHVWSLLRCAALAVHWWNPLVWLAVKLSRRDGELACDEGALKRLGDGERAAYGSTLLALVTAKATPGGLLTCSTAMAGDKKSLTERFSRIAKAPKRAVGIAVTVVVLAALVTVCAFGQKTEEESRAENGAAPVETEEPAASPAPSETPQPDEPLRFSGVTRVTGEFEYPPFETFTLTGREANELLDCLSALDLSDYEATAMPEGDGVTFTIETQDGSYSFMALKPWFLYDGSAYLLGMDSELFQVTDRIAARYGGTAGPAVDSPVPVEPAPKDESPAPDESEDPMASHFAGLVAAMAEESKPRRPAEDLADMTELPYHPDLNRNGVPETLLAGQYYRGDDPTGESALDGVGVWEDGELLWSSTRRDSPGAGCAFLLVERDDGDYLMEYSVWSGNGRCVYTYLGYDLQAPGQQMIFNEDTHFAYSGAEEIAQTFEAYDIADYIENANRLFSRSTVILDREGVFEDPDAPRISLSWLENFAVGFTWDDSASSLENLTRFKELALNPPSSAPVTDAASARAELKAALLGETDFTFWSSQGKLVTVDIDTAPPRAFESLSEEWEKYNSFAVVDLDGDGVEEVVYHVTDVAGDMGGHLILRWAGPGDLRCYSIPYSHLMDLKADGSFWYSMMAGMGGMGGTVRLSFPAPGYAASMQYLTEYNVSFTPETPYKVNGETVTKEEYDAVQAKQDAKPDAVWYDFTPENVKKVLG